MTYIIIMRNRINESNSFSETVSDAAVQFSDSIRKSLSEMKDIGVTDAVLDKPGDFENDITICRRKVRKIDWGTFVKPEKKYSLQFITRIFDLDVLCTVIVFDVSEFIYTQQRYIRAIEQSVEIGWFELPRLLHDDIPAVSFITTTYELETCGFDDIVEHEFMHLYHYSKNSLMMYDNLCDLREEIIEKNTGNDIDLNVIAKCVYYIERSEQSAYKQGILSEFKHSYKSMKELVDMGIEDEIKESDIESYRYDRIMKFFQKYVSEDSVVSVWKKKLSEIGIRDAGKISKMIYKKCCKFVDELRKMRNRFISDTLKYRQ